MSGFDEIFSDNFVSAKAYGAVGNGTADDSASIQEAIDFVYANGGGKVYIPAGTYKISTTLTLPWGVHIYGDGIGGDVYQHDSNFPSARSTVLRATTDTGDLITTPGFGTMSWKNITNASVTSGNSVVTSASFGTADIGKNILGLGISGTVIGVNPGVAGTVSSNASLSNSSFSNIWVGTYPSGYVTPSRFGLHDIVLDGGKFTGNTTGYVAKFWGRSYQIENVVFQNGPSGGVWSEYFGGGYDMESMWNNFYIINCEGDSLRWMGPHDSLFTNGIISAGSASANGVHLVNGCNVGGELFNNIHVWGVYNEYHWKIGTSSGNFNNVVADGGGIQVNGSGNNWYGTIYGTGYTTTLGKEVFTIGDGLRRTVQSNNFNGRVFNFGRYSKFIRYFGNDKLSVGNNVFKLNTTSSGLTSSAYYYGISGKGQLATPATAPITGGTLTLNDASTFSPGGGGISFGDNTNFSTGSYTGVSGNQLTGVNLGGTIAFGTSTVIYQTNDTANFTWGYWYDTHEILDSGYNGSFRHSNLFTNQADILYQNYSIGSLAGIKLPNGAGNATAFIWGGSAAPATSKTGIYGRVEDAGWYVNLSGVGTAWTRFPQSAPVVTKSGAYTALTTDGVILASNGGTVTLPSAVTAGSGRIYTVKNIGATGVTINSTSGNLDGTATKSLAAQYDKLSFISDGTNWFNI